MLVNVLDSLLRNSTAAQEFQEQFYKATKQENLRQGALSLEKSARFWGSRQTASFLVTKSRSRQYFC
ncbi:MAG: hypothetical protein A2461_07225 [Burkholderiales bacterium RIFOXYC2_FULL_59_8]|nr:MAG: hypothetical protein A2461_07225 [Burkholderiales bacterium RIFOXYC2_FULL_59_8]